MITLKEALKKGKIKQFIKERLFEEEEGDKERFDSTLSSMAQGKSPKARKASSQDDSEN